MDSGDGQEQGECATVTRNRNVFKNRGRDTFHVYFTIVCKMVGGRGGEATVSSDGQDAEKPRCSHAAGGAMNWWSTLRSDLATSAKAEPTPPLRLRSPTARHPPKGMCARTTHPNTHSSTLPTPPVITRSETSRCIHQRRTTCR